MAETMRFEQDGPVARLTLARADDGNLVTLEMMGEIAARIRECGRDPATKAIALSGDGADFCLGRDPKSAPEDAPRTAVDMRQALTAPILGIYDAVRGAEVPVIAVVQGRANGFGCATAAVCDVTIADADSRFSLPEMKHDLPPTLAMCAHIDRTMAKAIGWLVYSTDSVDAETARALGFVSHVAPRGELAATADAFLDQLTQRSRMALVTCKQYLANARLMETDKAADYAGNLLALVMSSK